MAMTYMVTDGAGFIGANLIRRLNSPAVHIRMLDNLSAGRRSDLAGLPVEFIQRDILESEVVDQAVRGPQWFLGLFLHTPINNYARICWGPPPRK